MRHRNHVPDYVSALHAQSHYVIRGMEIVVRQRGRPEEVITCQSQSEVQRHVSQLVDQGLTGLRAWVPG